MKAIVKLFLVVLVIMMGQLLSIAQDMESENSIYRVTAVHKLDNTVISVSNEVTVKPSVKYYIPNAFTPNGDGLNETFGIIGTGITDYTLQVFNRWGNLIFESNDVSVQWDGTYKNEPVPMDTYVYKINGKGYTSNGEKIQVIEKHGTVTVVL